MAFDPEKHHRRSIRLREYDYSQGGAYFVTLCTQNRECRFGIVTDGRMVLNKCGNVIVEQWNQTQEIRFNVFMDAFVVMPNHVHGIIVINRGRGDLPVALQNRTETIRSGKDRIFARQGGCLGNEWAEKSALPVALVKRHESFDEGKDLESYGQSGWSWNNTPAKGDRQVAPTSEFPRGPKSQSLGAIMVFPHTELLDIYPSESERIQIHP